MTKTTEHGNYAYDYDTSSRLTVVDNPVLDDENYTYLSACGHAQAGDDVGNRLTSADVSGSITHVLP